MLSDVCHEMFQYADQQWRLENTPHVKASLCQGSISLKVFLHMNLEFNRLYQIHGSSQGVVIKSHVIYFSKLCMWQKIVL